MRCQPRRPSTTGLTRPRPTIRGPHTQRYQLTSNGYRLAVFFTKSYIPIANPLADLGCALPAEIPDRTQIARAWRAYEHETDVRIADAGLTAWKDDSRVNLSGD